MSAFVKKLKKYDDFMELGGVSQDELNHAESLLGLKFANDYREYLEQCGIATADGREFTGLGRSKRLDVVNCTIEAWDEHYNVGHDLYVIELLGIDGIIIWQNQSGEIYQTTLGGEIKKIAINLADYFE